MAKAPRFVQVSASDGRLVALDQHGTVWVWHMDNAAANPTAGQWRPLDMSRWDGVATPSPTPPVP